MPISEFYSLDIPYINLSLHILSVRLIKSFISFSAENLVNEIFGDKSDPHT